MNRVTVTTAGFTINAADERVLAYREHLEQALAVMRSEYGAEKVYRVGDGALMATKLRAVRRTRQPFTLGRLGVAS